MSSPIDKEFGDMFIWGENKETGYVDLVWSSHRDEHTFHLIKKDADKLLDIWDNLKNKANELLDKNHE